MCALAFKGPFIHAQKANSKFQPTGDRCDGLICVRDVSNRFHVWPPIRQNTHPHTHTHTPTHTYTHTTYVRLWSTLRATRPLAASPDGQRRRDTTYTTQKHQNHHIHMRAERVVFYAVVVLACNM